MRWASAISRAARLDAAIRECALAIRNSLGGLKPDFGLAFFSANHFGDLSRVLLPFEIEEQMGLRRAIGCFAPGVIGGSQEVENGSAVAFLAVSAPGVEIETRVFDTDILPDEDASPETWRMYLGFRRPNYKLLIVLASVYSPRLEAFISGLDYAYPGAVAIGGLAGTPRDPDQATLIDGIALHSRRVVVAALAGNLAVAPVVAQGCRPIGRPLVVTQCENNILLEIDGKPPLHYLADLVDTLPSEDKALMKNSLLIGLLPEPFDEEPNNEPTYLIRNLVGIDYKRGILAVGARLTEGMLVQFHLRDRKASMSDIQRLLERQKAFRPQGALIFSCVGRGAQLYRAPNHDTRAIERVFGQIPIGGFFCNGEIGPVGRSTYLHGYTSAIALIRQETEETA